MSNLRTFPTTDAQVRRGSRVHLCNNGTEMGASGRVNDADGVAVADPVDGTVLVDVDVAAIAAADRAIGRTVPTLPSSVAAAGVRPMARPARPAAATAAAATAAPRPAPPAADAGQSFARRVADRAAADNIPRLEAMRREAQADPVGHQQYVLSQQPASAGRPTAGAAEEFSRLVQERMAEAGTGRLEAMQAVARSRPDLHRAFVLANQPAAPVRSSPAPTADVVREVDRRVEALKAAGEKSHSRAVCRVFSSDPLLHRQYLEYHNPGKTIVTG